MTAAIAAGVSAGAALAAGTVVGTAATLIAVGTVIAGTLVAASLVMTIVGLATGDSKLLKIGGYVGLAGGVAGLAAGAAGAATSSAAEGLGSAGTTTATEAASNVPTTVINQTPEATRQIAAVTNATAPMGEAFAQPLAVHAPLQAATPIGTNLAETGVQETARQATITGASKGLGSAVGANVGTSLAPKVAESQTGFFSFMDSPGFKNTLEVLKVGGDVIGNAATGSMNEDFINQKLDLQGRELGLIGERNAQTAAFNNAQLAQTQQQQDYNQMVQERQYQNANTQGRGILTARVLTAEERLAASRAKAQQAAANAQILTGAA